MTTISRNCAHRYSSQNCNLSIISCSLSNSSFCYENTLSYFQKSFDFQSKTDAIRIKRLTYPWKCSKLKIFNRKNVLHRDTFPLRMMLGLLIFKRVAAVYRRVWRALKKWKLRTFRFHYSFELPPLYLLRKIRYKDFDHDFTLGGWIFDRKIRQRCNGGKENEMFNRW